MKWLLSDEAPDPWMRKLQRALSHIAGGAGHLGASQYYAVVAIVAEGQTPRTSAQLLQQVFEVSFGQGYLDAGAMAELVGCAEIAKMRQALAEWGYRQEDPPPP